MSGGVERPSRPSIITRLMASSSQNGGGGNGIMRGERERERERERRGEIPRAALAIMSAGLWLIQSSLIGRGQKNLLSDSEEEGMI